MKYIITKTDPLLPYVGMNDGTPLMDCRQVYTLFDISCFAISEPLFDTIYPLIPAGYEEVEETVALQGAQHFSEIREEIKVFVDNPNWDYTEALPDAETQKIPFSDEMKANVLVFMKTFAKEIIETEYNFRFKNIRNSTELEQASWDIQKHEAKEWLTYGEDENHITPFLDYLATEHNRDKTELSNSIIENSEYWNDKLSNNLVKSQKVLKKFSKCVSIWDMNILYEDYFGIMMPNDQSHSIGRSDENGIRYVYDENNEIIAQEQNNPRFGNKFNF